MRRTALLVALLAALSLFAATATSASALPEFTPPFPKPLVSEGGLSVLETVGKNKIECAVEHNAGEISAPTAGVVTIILNGCKLFLPSGIIPCNTEGAAPEEVVTKPLPATLGYIKHTPLKTIVGLELSKGETPIASIFCGGVHVLVIGSFIGKLGPINKVVKPFPAGHFNLVFSQKGGKQMPKNFEGMPPNLFLTSIGGGPFEGTGYASKDVLGFAEAVEIIA